jgi:hypothetical protein
MSGIFLIKDLIPLFPIFHHSSFPIPPRHLIVVRLRLIISDLDQRIRFSKSESSSTDFHETANMIPQWSTHSLPAATGAAAGNNRAYPAGVFGEPGICAFCQADPNSLQSVGSQTFLPERQQAPKG